MVAKLGGVTNAAEKLNTSQSSLSAQIKTLENHIGKTLFKKVGRKIELTEAGKDLFNYCRRAFEIFDEMSDHFNKKSLSMGIRITIGVSQDIDRPFVADTVAMVRSRYSQSQQPRLNLITTTDAVLQQGLQSGEIDFIITNRAFVDHTIDILGEFDLPVGAFGYSEFYKLTKKDSFDDLLKKEKIALCLPSKMTDIRTEIDRYMIKKNITPYCVFESNAMASVTRATLDGLGATIMPLPYVKKELESKQLFILTKKVLWKHRTVIIGLKDRIETERMQFAHHFNDCLLKIIQDSQKLLT